MGEVTAISWCDHTFNPWIGCTKVSPACDGCYAEALMDKRYGRVEWGAPGKGVGTRVRTSKGNWHQPLRWNKKAETEGTRPFVFCSSLADVFDNQVPTAWRTDLFELIRSTPHLVWLLLTKRPQNIVRMYGAAFDMPWPRNAAIGTTVEDQERANLNVPALLEAKAELRPAFAFLSCEPLLGPVNIHEWVLGFAAGHPAHCTACGKGHGFDRCPNYGSVSKWRSKYDGGPIECEAFVHDPKSAGGIDWVITGGETDQGGHRARPTHPLWFRSLRDKCERAGVPFHHKQNGEWARHQFKDNGSLKGEVVVWPNARTDVHNANEGGGPGVEMDKVGKTKSGRLLDGVEHNARPEVH